MQKHLQLKKWGFSGKKLSSSIIDACTIPLLFLYLSPSSKTFLKNESAGTDTSKL